MIELLWNAPVSESKMAEYIETLQLHPRQYVMDFGCGCGEFLIRLAERYQIRGTGIDSSPAHINEAMQRSGNRSADSIRFVEQDTLSYAVPHDSIDLAVCMGATHSFGLGPNAFRNAISRLSSYVAPDGMLLVADGYMKQPAPPEYRKLLGDSMPDEKTHASNVKSAMEFGLIPLAAWTSTEDEWDTFEWTYQRIIEEKAEANPDDQEIINKRDQRREWIDAYLKWGRYTLGYGTYLFRKPFSQERSMRLTNGH